MNEDRACALYQEGMTVAEAAAAVGTSPHAVYRAFRDRGIPLRTVSRPPSAATLARAASMAEAVKAGRTLRDVGQAFGVSGERVRQILEQYHPGFLSDVLRVRSDEARQREDERREARLVNRECGVCAARIRVPSNRRTCDNDDCVWLWTMARHHFDWPHWAAQKLAQARYDIRTHPADSARGRRAAAVIDCYERTGGVPAANRVYLDRNSETWKRLVRVLGADGAEELIERRKREAAAMDIVRVLPPKAKSSPPG